MPAQPEFEGFDLTPVTTAHSHTNRNPSLLTVKTSGYTYTDTEATREMLKNLPLFGSVSLENLLFWYGVNPNTGMVGIYVDAKGDHPGSTPVKVNANTLYFHIGGVFKEHPHLRPAGTIECGLTFTKDAKGNPCFVFNVLKGMPKRSTRRKGSGGGDSTTTETAAQKQPAAGQQGPAQPEPGAADKE
ncbi:MAG TPA: hypothetical protein VNT01_17510 [Symbiobacteriaceae bacterium]|nr:hypothetical protein [Symbiobacteriaceae bacterium]